MFKDLWHKLSYHLPVILPEHMHGPSSKTVFILEKIIWICLATVLIGVPLIFSGSTLEPLEIHKQLFLVFFVSIGTLAWIVKAFFEKRVSLSRHWLHFGVAVFGVTYLLSGLFSVDRALSFFGLGGQQHWAVITMLACLGMYALVIHRLRSLKEVYDFVFCFLIAGFFVGLFGIAQMLGWHLFSAAYTQSKNFTSLGSVYGFSLFMVIPLLLSVAIHLHGCRDKRSVLGVSSWQGNVARAFLWIVMVVSFISLVLVDYWPSWMMLLVGSGVMIGATLLRQKGTREPIKLVAPVLFSLIALFLLFVRMPFHPGILREVAPSTQSSWHIARQVLQKDPVLGSGPGTWVYAYSQYRSPLMNASPFWNIRFDRANSTVLTMLPTMGILGVLTWLILAVLFIVESVRHLRREKQDDAWYAWLMVFSSWLTLFIGMFLYPLSLAHQMLFWFLTALLGGLMSRHVYIFDMRSIIWRNVTFGAKALAMLVLVGIVWSMTYTRYRAERWFAKAVYASQMTQPLDGVIGFVERARILQPENDLYIRNLAQARIVRALSTLRTASSSTSPAVIEADVGSGIQLAQEAVRLAPMDVDNWASLAGLYAFIAPITRGADEAAIKAYEQGLIHEPQNPFFYDEIGRLRLAQAEGQSVLMNSRETKIKEQAKKQRDRYLTEAKSALKKSISIKEDYLPARYHLAQVYERENKLSDAIKEVSAILRVRNRDVGVAFELAILLYRNQQPKEALNLLQQIVSADPQNVNARWYLGILFEEMGQKEEARAVFERLAAQFPENMVIQQRLIALTKPAIKPAPLPEPITEEIQGRGSKNSVKTKR